MGLSPFAVRNMSRLGVLLGVMAGKVVRLFLPLFENLQTLLDFRYNRRFKAENGGKGGSKNCTGATGDDLNIDVPCGTIVYDCATDEVLVDLVEPGQTFKVVAGGKGGLGNAHFLSNSNRAPEYALPGQPPATKTDPIGAKIISRSWNYRFAKCW